ncbi:MAG: hypothetical protein R2822_28285 [Spirosomataceae bacterium]
MSPWSKKQFYDAAKVSKKDLNAIAFTRGMVGRRGALLVGEYRLPKLLPGLEVPLIEVNHMQAHVLAHFTRRSYTQVSILCLTVSGGHTQIVCVRSALDMEIIGQNPR